MLNQLPELHQQATDKVLELSLSQPRPLRLHPLDRAAKGRTSQLVQLVVHQLVEDDVSSVGRLGVDDGEGHTECDARRPMQGVWERGVDENAHAVGKVPQNGQLLLEKRRLGREETEEKGRERLIVRALAFCLCVVAEGGVSNEPR